MKATHEFTVKLHKRSHPIGSWYAKLPSSGHFGITPEEINTEELRLLFREFIDNLPLEVMLRYRDVYASNP